MRRVVVIGGAGQLGQDLQLCWPATRPDDQLVVLTHADIEVLDRASVASALTDARPGLVVNTSAFHRVDDIEDDPAPAFAVNALGALNLARTCRELDVPLMHVSTDYVFGGAQRTPYVESDPVDPINTYGVSKASGEMLIRATWPRHYIVRSSGLYGVAGSAGKGGNFVETMLRLAASGHPIRVVDDQVLTPTHTRALAMQMAELAGVDDFGTYHATCDGECSWHEFALAIFDLASLQPPLSRQTTSESGARARRPSYSVLGNSALQRLGIDRMPSWREALADYFQARSSVAPAS